MPPLLAALFLLEFGCGWRIIQAIDLGMEWRRLSDGFMNNSLRDGNSCFNYPINWFNGALGIEFFPSLSSISKRAGSYVWPVNFRSTLTLLDSPRFYNKV